MHSSSILKASYNIRSSQLHQNMHHNKIQAQQGVNKLGNPRLANLTNT